VQILGVGAIFATAFVLSRSLLAVILAHFAFDFLQLQFAKLLPWAEQLAEQAQQTP
jgi:hypothetical protein